MLFVPLLRGKTSKRQKEKRAITGGRFTKGATEIGTGRTATPDGPVAQCHLRIGVRRIQRKRCPTVEMRLTWG